MTTYQIPALFIDEIVETQRLGDTDEGNPCYRVRLRDHGRFETYPDAAVAYVITNRELNSPNHVYVAVENDKIIGVEQVLSRWQ